MGRPACFFGGILGKAYPPNIISDSYGLCETVTGLPVASGKYRGGHRR
jgi:hypothetical protein